MTPDTVQENSGVSRKEFLQKAAIGGAIVMGVGMLVKGAMSKSGGSKASAKIWWTEDSIFKPRADHAARILRSGK